MFRNNTRLKLGKWIDYEGLHMSNEELTSNPKTSGHYARMDAYFSKVVTVHNTTILFWVAFALYLLYTSYVPPGAIESRWIIVLARIAFLSTIGLWMLADGRTRKVEEKWLMYYFLGSVLVPLVVIALPIYLVHSRGLVGVAKSILRFAGYLLLAFVIWYGVVGVLLMFEIHEVGTPTIAF